MDYNDVVKISMEFVSRQFPKECSFCGKQFVSLKDYYLNTTHSGKPISYDAEFENWNTTNPTGTYALSNCFCGSTLVLSSRGMNAHTMRKLLQWIRKETRQRGVEVQDLLEELRATIDQKLLQDDDMDGSASDKWCN